jgi:hypothetical protein
VNDCEVRTLADCDGILREVMTCDRSARTTIRSRPDPRTTIIEHTQEEGRRTYGARAATSRDAAGRIISVRSETTDRGGRHEVVSIKTSYYTNGVVRGELASYGAGRRALQREVDSTGRVTRSVATTSWPDFPAMTSVAEYTYDACPFVALPLPMESGHESVVEAQLAWVPY